MASGNIELHQLRCFVAVAKELNFRKAAVRLNMTQPPLSRQVQLLEHAVGCRLFERTNRNVTLTPAGESLYKSATEILLSTEHSVLKARQAERGELGEVHVGAVPSSAIDVMPKVVSELNKSLPTISIRSVEMMSYEIIEGLRRGEIDFGLTRSHESGKDIESVRVLTEDLILVVHKDHPLAVQPKVTMQDLDGQPFVGYSWYRGGVLHKVHQALFALTHSQPTIVQEVSQTQTMLAMVNQGLGLALVPMSACAQRMENLCFRAINLPPGITSDLYLCQAIGRESPLLNNVKTEIKKVIGEFQEYLGSLDFP